MQYVTAVFGENYVQAGLALQRTFNRSNSDPLTVFTDQAGIFQNEEIANMENFVSEYSNFYDMSGTGRRNVFKYSVMREVQNRCPDQTICWIDADILILDDLSRHLVEGAVNVIAHGRRSEEFMNVGGGLKVPASHYAISGLFSVPPGPALAYLFEVAHDRPDWTDDGSPNHKIGDQLILNHLIAKTDFPRHWLTDDRRFIYNLEIAGGRHPVLGDAGLRRIRWRWRHPILDGRRLVVFYWIKNHLDAHIESGFSSFRPGAAKRLAALYSI